MLHRTIVEYYADHEGYRCGYCKSPNTNYSYGMWSHSMTVGDYQNLVDRGWRRSGRYVYKPTMSETCCPMYTIRCRALEFKATKSQKKVLKRCHKYLMGQEVSGRKDCGNRKMSTGSSETDMSEEYEEGAEQFVESTNEPQDININNIVKAEEELTDEPAETPKANITIQPEFNQKPIHENLKQKEVKKGDGPDPSKGPHKKAKQMRRERKLEKLKEKGIDISTFNNKNKNKEKEIEDFINELPGDLKHKLEIKLVRTSPQSPEWKATMDETFQVYFKYQTCIHNDKPEKCVESKFHEFLVHSPLLEEHSETGPACGYGSFHQQYRLDGKLVAVGVLDILPKCVSSVYFFYDPQYTNLTLGTYGAMREIAFTRQLHQLCPELKHYYMGFYIHSCQKMRYKGNFAPSDLLCPETYKWFPLKDCIPMLEKSPYSRLDPDIDSIDVNHPLDGDVNQIPLLFKNVIMPYKSFKKKGYRRDFEERLVQYSQLVGSMAAKQLILVAM